MYIINTIPHGKCFVRYLRTCFCISSHYRNENRLAVWVILEIFGTVLLKAHDWSSWILKNCEMLYSVRGLYDKKCCFTSDVMYKKYKKLVYTPSGLLTRICKVNLWNAKKCGLICFPRIFLFSRPNLLWSRAIMALECDRRCLLFFWGTYNNI